MSVVPRDAAVAAGDVVVRIGDAPTPSVDDLTLALARHRPGQRVPVTVRRDGEPRTLGVALGEAG